MEKRVRLTKEMAECLMKRSAGRRTAGDFGTMNQPERQFVENDKYDKPLDELNHPNPDMRNEWQNEKRDEANRAARSERTARLWRVANKSTRLAARFLGDKAPAQMIEDQALDFAMLGEDAIDTALARYNETADLYKDEQEGCAEAKAEVCPECGKEPCECEKQETAKAEETPAEETKPAETEATETENIPAEYENIPAEKAEQEEKPADNITSEGEDFEVEFGGSAGNDVFDSKDENDKELEGLFDDNGQAAVNTKTAKKGVQTMSQPRIATASARTSLEGLWESAPDVSEYFK